MAMREIGHGGQPLRTVFRRVHPPRAVLVDLVALFPREPHSDGKYHPTGLQMDSIVEGHLTCWGLSEQGRWWGLVTYRVKHGAEKDPVTHWVPASVLKLK
jgi:hypothetical protein